MSATLMFEVIAFACMIMGAFTNNFVWAAPMIVALHCALKSHVSYKAEGVEEKIEKLRITK